MKIGQYFNVNCLCYFKINNKDFFYNIVTGRKYLFIIDFACH